MFGGLLAQHIIGKRAETLAPFSIGEGKGISGGGLFHAQSPEGESSYRTGATFEKIPPCHPVYLSNRG